MKQTNESMMEKDSDILFSKTVKAGKRVYYIDVKRDRRDAYYLSITESKRIKEGSAEERPVFEKHKIFLYREDIEKFMSALIAATGYALANGSFAPAPNNESNNWSKSEDVFSAVEREDEGAYTGEHDGEDSGSEQKIKIDLDF